MEWHDRGRKYALKHAGHSKSRDATDLCEQHTYLTEHPDQYLRKAKHDHARNRSNNHITLPAITQLITTTNGPLKGYREGKEREREGE
jgi:hypothetical protein